MTIKELIAWHTDQGRAAQERARQASTRGCRKANFITMNYHRDTVEALEILWKVKAAVAVLELTDRLPENPADLYEQRGAELAKMEGRLRYGGYVTITDDGIDESK